MRIEARMAAEKGPAANAIAFLNLSRSREMEEGDETLALNPFWTGVALDTNGWVRSLSQSVVKVTYAWEARKAVLQLSRLRCKGEKQAHSLRVLVDVVMPFEDKTQSVSFEVPRDGKLRKAIPILGLAANELEAAEAKLFGGVKDGGDVAIAKGMQYYAWPFWRLFNETRKREQLHTKPLSYSAMMSRKQRYAVITCMVLVAAFFTVLLFRDTCVTEPLPPECTKEASVLESLMAWDVIFGGLWGMVMGVPAPLALTLLFKKSIVLGKMTDLRKQRMMTIWLWKERVGWILVFVIHAGSFFFLYQFVRFYDQKIIKKWMLSTLMSIFHQFISAPALRMLWVVILLAASRKTNMCDLCVANSPQITDFPNALTSKLAAPTKFNLWSPAAGTVRPGGMTKLGRVVPHEP